MDIGSYITGFVDGEGSFLVSFSKRSAFSTGVEIRPAFTVSQHERNKEILGTLKRFFGCGTIRFNKRDHTWKYEVRALSDLLDYVIPHFIVFPLQTSKQNDFVSFKQICFKMKKREHLLKCGLRQMIDDAYHMNNYGARRYIKSDLLNTLRKMKV